MVFISSTTLWSLRYEHSFSSILFLFFFPYLLPPHLKYFVILCTKEASLHSSLVGDLVMVYSYFYGVVCWSSVWEGISYKTPEDHLGWNWVFISAFLFSSSKVNPSFWIVIGKCLQFRIVFSVLVFSLLLWVWALS